ncbi:MAG TPA: hypothetical protein VFE47_25045 [Tepidisphaeraceae bacterium]|jgi:hypothetical protein|nr:hypothetical protein [Tepidisphaeraceae bacterium]
MATPSVAAIDTLNSLLEAEVNSIFHFVGEGSPYLSKAAPAIRQPLEGIRQHLDQHEKELSDLIRQLGGEPAIPPKPDPDEQYLKYLSLKFLLPKLIEAKKLMIDRYHHAGKLVKDNPGIVELLDRHTKEMQIDLAVLNGVAAQVAV